jgi:hypothetical protein
MNANSRPSEQGLRVAIYLTVDAFFLICWFLRK